MIRQRAIKRNVGVEKSFRWRGGEVTRIEGFSDAVFAFAMTLLVVSLEVPSTFQELADKMLGFIAFAITFLLFMRVWYWHYTYFRRYGLQDAITIILNSVLLFVLLLYVFPLKFLFTLLVDQVRGAPETVIVGGKVESVIEGSQWNSLMIIFGIGYVAVHSLFVLLYWHAYSKRSSLDLNPLEIFYTTSNIWLFLCLTSVGVISMILAAISEPASVSWSGFTYMLIVPVVSFFRRSEGRHIRELEAQNGSGGGK